MKIQIKASEDTDRLIDLCPHIQLVGKKTEIDKGDYEYTEPLLVRCSACAAIHTVILEIN